jgi:hypothetical protein
MTGSLLIIKSSKYLKDIFIFLLLSICILITLVSIPNISNEQIVIFLALTIMFLPIIIFLINLNSLILNIFFFIIYLTHVIGSILFFGNKNSFNYDGFNAIKNFDFNIKHYLIIYSYLFLFWYVIVLFFWVFKKKKFNVAKKIKNEHFIKKKTSEQIVSNLFYFLTLIFSAILINWMFQNSLGITGIDPVNPVLTFHLGGFLYYYLKFINPLLIFFLLKRINKPGFIHFLILLLTAIIYGVGSASRFAFSIYTIILLYFLIINKRYILLFLTLIIFSISLSFIEISRNFIYGSQNKNEAANFNIVEHINNVNSSFIISDIDFSLILSAMFFRIGGTQDVVLAYQYDNSRFGGSFSEFIRYAIYSKYIDVNDVQSEMFDWLPPIDSGFSTGDGGLSAEVLLIANKSYLKTIYFAIFIGLLILIFDSFYKKSLIYNSFFKTLNLILCISAIFFMIIKTQTIFIYILIFILWVLHKLYYFKIKLK